MSLIKCLGKINLDESELEILDSHVQTFRKEGKSKKVAEKLAVTARLAEIEQDIQDVQSAITEALKTYEPAKKPVEEKKTKRQKAKERAAQKIAERKKKQQPKFSKKKIQTQTKAFKEWFGDSKVVDENGEPLVVYHGTATPSFTTFKRQRGGWSGGIGIWFGSHPNIANEFAKTRFADQGAAVYPVFLKINNPMQYAGWADFTEAARATGKVDIGDMQRSLRNSLIRKRYDGIVIRGSDTDMGGTRDDWVAFEPTQIKSAIGNIGTFDKTDTRITHSKTTKPTGLQKQAVEKQLLSSRFAKPVKKMLDSGKLKIVQSESELPGSAKPLFTRTNELEQNVKDLSSSLEKEDGVGTVHLYITNIGNLKLDTIIIKKEFRNRGVGTKIVEQITDFADANGLNVVLTPAIRDDFQGTTSRSRLVKFYKRFGFKENKGRNKDYRIFESMVRRAKIDDAKFSKTQTKSFTKWFGDSKVVDENGDPLVVYHGTGTVIEEFSFDFTDQGNDQLGSGFYFTTDVTEAEGYTKNRIQSDTEKLGGEDKPNIIEAYLSIQNPIPVGYVTHGATKRNIGRIIDKSPDLDDALQNWGDVEFSGKSKVRSEAIEGYYPGKGAEAELIPFLNNLANDFYSGKVEAFNKVVKEVFGYDGVVAEFEGKKHYVAFFPEQIKSAIGNRGTFDPNDPRINYSVSESIQGAYYKDQDTIYMVADGLTQNAVEPSFLHEAFHGRSKEVLGDKQYRRLMQRLANLEKLGKNNPALDKHFKAAREAIPEDTPEADRLEEFAAYTLESYERAPKSLHKTLINWVKDFISAIRVGLMRLGWMPKNITPQDLSAIARASVRKFAETDAIGQAAPAYSQIKPQPKFYSALTRSVENIKMNTAPATQWKATIAKLTQKGAKQEEIDWLGVNEWLDDQTGKVTKEQVLDFLNANEVQVDEVPKGGGNISELANDVEIIDGQDSEGNQALVMTYSDFDGYVGYSYDNGETFNLEGKNDESAIGMPEYHARRLLVSWLHDEYPNAFKYDYTDTKFAQWQLPGAIEGTYRELLLTLPTRANRSSQEWMDAAKSVYAEKDIPRLSEAQKEIVDRKTSGRGYKGPHYDELDVLAHIRFNERTDADGNRVLFIEEVQSDWHQKGRQEGYKGTEGGSKELYAIRYKKSGALERYAPTIRAAEIYIDSRFANPDEYSIGKETVEKTQAVPNAPFKTTWPLLAFKRMIRYAAENGFDSIGWTTGEQQAERYKLSTQINMVSAIANKNGNYNLVVEDKHGQEVDPYRGGGKEMDAAEMEGVIGKDLTRKLIEGAESVKDKPWPKGVKENPAFFTIRGIDLDVGGEGMKSFYDRMLPSMVNKYVKKWGG